MTHNFIQAFTASESFDALLTQKLEPAFVDNNIAPSLGLVVASERPELAAFQCNGALKAAKMAGLNPRDVAQNILDSLEKDALIARADIAGAGFINIDITHEALSKKINSLWDDPRLGVGKVLNPRRIIIDFGGPNVAKPMHVGHLRTAVIGESLKRIFRFMGDTVMGDAHFGDWGYQMGLLITALGDEMPDLAYFSEDPQHDYPSTSPVTLFDLERLYPLASAKAKADTEYRDRARRATKALQDGREGYRALWKHFVTVSREALIRDYNDLGVTFDWWYGESDADAYIAPMIEDLMAKNLLVADQGAMVIHVAKDDDTRALPPLLVISSEGSSMYGTTDLATIRQRQEQYNPDLVLYCVDKRQSDHFEQVFRASDLAGYIGHSALEHAANGTVNGVDGKPFKTREGGVLKLGDLIDQAVSKAQTRLMEAGLGADLDAEEFSDTAKKIAIAAIKFAELSNHRLTNYVFDLDRFMSFEGKTGPYLMYQAVRMKSILRKSKALGLCGAEITVSMPAEVELTLLLDRFDAALRDTYLKRAPNILADHIFRLAQAFSKFYAACPVLIGDDDAIKASRIRIVELVLRQLEKGLELMGLSAPQRM